MFLWKYRTLILRRRAENRLSPEDTNFSDGFVQNDIFWYMSAENGENVLKGIALKGGAKYQFPAEGISVLAPGENDLSYGIRSARKNGQVTYSLVSVHLVSGEITELASLDSSLAAICLDTKNQQILIADSGRLLSWREGMETPEVSAWTMGGDSVGVCPIGENSAAVLIDNAIAIRRLGSAESQMRLVVRQGYGRGENYQEFLTAHPEITLSFEANSSMTAEEEFVQDMINRSSDKDIYILTDPETISVIHQKGYGLELTESEKMAAIAEDYYDAFRELFVRDGKMYAVPQTLYITAPGVQKDFFETAGIETPRTVAELMEITKEWTEEDRQEETLLNPFKNLYDLPHLLSRAADEYSLNGKEVRLCTDEMIRLLDEWLETYRLVEDMGNVNSEEIAMNIIDLPMHIVYDALILPVSEEHEGIIGAADLEMTYLVINPFTEHPEEAMAFVESVAESWDARMRLLLLSSGAQASESAEYATEKANLEAELQEARAAETPDESRISSLERSLERLEETRWEISEEDVEWYQGILPRIQFSESNPVLLVLSEDDSLLAQFMGGKMDAEGFLKALDQKVEMVQLERE